MTKQEAAKNATLGVVGTVQKGLQLSDVIYEFTNRIKAHPENATLFKQEDEQYFERLKKDVMERGIIVPLIVKDDNTLLAGHNRLRVAQELGLTTVPVQFVDDKLTEQQEREFLIKDNLFRRQLAREEWMTLYRALYPNFDERIEIKAVGRKPKEVEQKEIPQAGGIVSESPRTPITAREIAQATGQKERTVQNHLQKEREAKQEVKEAVSESVVFRKSEKVHKRYNDAVMQLWRVVESKDFLGYHSLIVDAQRLLVFAQEKFHANDGREKQ
jgi:ParB-like chromosome segregation protein Spo0J